MRGRIYFVLVFSLTVLIVGFLLCRNGYLKGSKPKSAHEGPALKNLLANGEFERAMADWKLFVPAESQAAGCNFTTVPEDRQGGRLKAQLTSATPARFGLFPDRLPMAVRYGDRYRLTAWVKADADFQVQAGTPGITLRATLFENPEKDFPGGHIFVGAKGVAIGNPALLAGSPPPREWTKIEATIKIPHGVNYLIFFVFVWRASGKLWVDDISMVKVDASTPLTPLLQ